MSPDSVGQMVDDDARRLDRTRRAVMLTLFIIANGAGVVNLFGQGSSPTAGLVLLAGGNLSVFLAWVLNRAGRGEAAGLALAITAALISTSLQIVGLGLHDVAMMGFPLTILLAGLLLRPAAFLASLALVLGGLALVAWAEHTGWTGAPPAARADWIDYVSVAAVLIGVATFTRLLVRAFRDSLERALAGERTLAAANLELEARNARMRVQEAERDRLIAELEAKNAELERFAYTASHDLKTPLVTIRAYVGYMLRDAAAGNLTRLEEDGKRIVGASDRMRLLLDDLLELSRVGRVLNPPSEIPLVELVREVADQVQGRLDASRVKLDIDPDLPAVRGDRRRLFQVFQNLIDNAAKFTGGQAAPRIEVGAERKGDETILYVRDNGAGIDPRHQERIFGLFEKLEAGGTGTGVGLALARRIIEAHGGRIWVESPGEGGGATFCFTLPSP